MHYEPLLQIITDRYAKILGDNFVGIYLHGSIAFQCFAWNKSDIDFIVVVNHKVSKQHKLELLQVLEALREQAPPKGFEMSVVQLRFCTHFAYPTPYELHFSNNCHGRYLENPLALCGDDIKTDFDLATHFTVIKHTGIVLCGPPIPTLFGNIPKEHYIDSICRDIQNAKQDVLHNPAYIVLNLCRVYAYLRDTLILSKEQGAQWGLDHLPTQYAPVITESRNNYSLSKPLCPDNKPRVDFCNYMLKKIVSATTPT